jgi:hypothetical protein
MFVYKTKTRIADKLPFDPCLVIVIVPPVSTTKVQSMSPTRRLAIVRVDDAMTI